MPPSKQRALKTRRPNKTARKQQLAAIRQHRHNPPDVLIEATSSLVTGPESTSLLTTSPASTSILIASTAPTNSIETSPAPTSSALDNEHPPLSATRRKLALYESETLQGSGNIESTTVLPTAFVNLNLLQPLFRGYRCNQCRHGHMQLVQKGATQGLAICLTLECVLCRHECQPINTSERMEDRSFNINRAAVAASLAGGFGYSGLKHFSEFLNMPLLSESSFQYHADKIHHVACDFKNNLLDKSASIVRNAHVDSNPELQDKDIIDITVSYDGSWHTRGHTSNNGVGCVIDSKTGLVIDYHIMSKFCKLCVTEGEKVRKESESSYDEWMLRHKPFCLKNFDLSSGAMEVEAALVCWQRSEERGFRYVNVISDGDCKTIKKINEARPYGSVEVQKEECVNHVAKRLGKALRDLVETKKKQKITLGGRGEGRLTQTKIAKLQKYYTRAIRSNNTLEGMRASVLGTFLHCTSTDENPQHSSCPEGADSWCFFQRAIAMGDSPASHKLKVSSFLSAEVAKHVKVVYERMSSDDLLGRCLAGQTQNANESLHSVLWARCPKHIFVNRKRLETSIAVAVGEFNQGSAATRQFMRSLGVFCGVLTDKHGLIRDKRRAYFSNYAELDKNKKRKKLRDEAKKKEMIESMDREREKEGGLLYEAGGDD